MKEMKRRQFVPDAITIPYQVVADSRLEAFDRQLYGILHWMEHVRGGKCDPSNEELADASQSTARTVQGSLARLEECGYVERDFKGKSDRHRVGIRTMVSFRSNPVQPVLATLEPETPGEFARRFFSGDEEALASVAEWISAKASDKAVGDAMAREISKFVAYWTEPNKTGKKVRWEMEKVFEVRRRMATWLSRSRERFGSRGGTTV